MQNIEKLGSYVGNFFNIWKQTFEGYGTGQECAHSMGVCCMQVKPTHFYKWYKQLQVTLVADIIFEVKNNFIPQVDLPVCMKCACQLHVQIVHLI